MSAANYHLFRTIVLTSFREEVNPTDEYIDKVINAILSVPLLWGGGEISDNFISELKLEIKEKYGIRMDLGHFLDNQEVEFID